MSGKEQKWDITVHFVFISEIKVILIGVNFRNGTPVYKNWGRAPPSSLYSSNRPRFIELF